jgi:hypothetical protein
LWKCGTIRAAVHHTKRGTPCLGKKTTLGGHLRNIWRYF